MSSRYESIGIKQTIRREWMDKVVNLLLAGLDAKAIRAELHEYMSDKNADGSVGKRSENTRNFVVVNLMNIWVNPPQDILPLRDDALAIIKDKPDLLFAMHWTMFCAVYPFWYNTAVQVGRLLNLQDQVTKKQIISRLKEKYGDREIIGRYSQYVIQAFGYWGVLAETEKKGFYLQGKVSKIIDEDAIALMFEAVLLTQKEGRSTVGELINSPGLLPFSFTQVSASHLVSLNKRLYTSSFSTGDEYISIGNS